jgi:ATP synthase protein I
MTGDQTPRRPGPPASGADVGWSVVGYLLSGILFWGFVGWAIDHWAFDTHGIATMVGILLGGAAGVYLVIKRMSG